MCLRVGFQPTAIYDVVTVYETTPLAGLGLAAIRGAISLLKYGSADALGIPGGAFDYLNRLFPFSDEVVKRCFSYDADVCRMSRSEM